MEQLKPQQVAVFALGLGPDSRIKTRLSGLGSDGMNIRYLLAVLIDAVHTLAWAQSGQGERPKSVADIMRKGVQNTERKEVIFDDAESFEAMRNEILKGGS